MDKDNTKEEIRQRILQAGATAVGFASACEVDADYFTRFSQWASSEMSKSVPYMTNYPEIRKDPRLLLDGAKTIITTAWNYLPQKIRPESLPYIAYYAYSRDYHKSIRSLLKPICRHLSEEYKAATRICIDSAPILERYWAVKSGVGFIGKNGLLILPDNGSWHFLAEIITDLELNSDSPNTCTCLNCGKCTESCPTGALSHDGFIDTRKCLSALTLEKPGCAPVSEFSPLAGCDICQKVCPHNSKASPGTIFETLPQVFSLDRKKLENMTVSEFKERFAGTSLQRPALSGLLANLAKITTK